MHRKLASLQGRCIMNRLPESLNMLLQRLPLIQHVLHCATIAAKIRSDAHATTSDCSGSQGSNNERHFNMHLCKKQGIVPHYAVVYHADATEQIRDINAALLEIRYKSRHGGAQSVVVGTHRGSLGSRKIPLGLSTPSGSTTSIKTSEFFFGKHLLISVRASAAT
jgi:hypothetical protein